MRILVLSDSHGDTNAIHTAIEEQPAAHTILFCGDGIGSIDFVEDAYPDRTFIAVRGNCDWRSMEQTLRIVEVGGKKIMVTHGHEQYVKSGTGPLIQMAKNNGCHIVVYGHTHKPDIRYDENLFIMNPGSAARQNSHTYGWIDITPGGIVGNIVEL